MFITNSAIHQWSTSHSTLQQGNYYCAP